MLETNELRVRIGSGSRSHVFRAQDGSNMKLFTLRDGGTAYDRALCGTGGEMRLAADSMEPCKTCQSILDREAEEG